MKTSPTGYWTLENMRFRIPPEHREAVTIVRQSAMDPQEEDVIAKGVVCMLQPIVSGTVQRDALELRTGIAIQETDRMALLSKPNMDIAKGDFLKGSDASQYRVIDVLHIKGSAVMRLYVRAIGVL